MIITPESIKSIRSFKFGYSRGKPSYMFPKLLTGGKMEEYFITSIYAQGLFYENVSVIGVEVCEDDKDKGADSIIKILDKEDKTVQVTRFTLTEYLGRVNKSQKKIDSLITEILNFVTIDFQLNISFHLIDDSQIPKTKKTTEKKLARFIADLIINNKTQLQASNDMIYCKVTDELIKKNIPYISLQSIPKNFYSSFFGRDNIFIDYDFDKIRFSKKDIDNESLRIYNRKNGGKAKVLIIWTDLFEILYDFPSVAESLKAQFSETSFEKVILFSFYNNFELYKNQKVHIAEVK